VSVSYSGYLGLVPPRIGARVPDRVALSPTHFDATAGYSKSSPLFITLATFVTLITLITLVTLESVNLLF
jgi:hypothetical protein